MFGPEVRTLDTNKQSDGNQHSISEPEVRAPDTNIQKMKTNTVVMYGYKLSVKKEKRKKKSN